MKKAFTLIEMVFVMLILGIITMMFMGMTGNQIQKLQQKSVKEALLMEYQMRYSKNLTSSFFAGTGYDQLQITITSGSNKIHFVYFLWGTEVWSDDFQGQFEVQSIISGSETSSTPVVLSYAPYKISCQIRSQSGDISELWLVIKMKDQQDYYFTISRGNCRLREIKEHQEWLPQYLSS